MQNQVFLLQYHHALESVEGRLIKRVASKARLFHIKGKDCFDLKGVGMRAGPGYKKRGLAT